VLPPQHPAALQADLPKSHDQWHTDQAADEPKVDQEYEAS